MNFFRNFWAHYSIIATAVIAFLLFYMKSCNKPVPCPEQKAIHSVDTIYKTITTHGDTSAIKQAGKSYVQRTYSVRTAYVQDDKHSMMDEINLCGETKKAYDSSYTYSVPVCDSLTDGTLTETISQNRITDYFFTLTHGVIHITDTIPFEKKIPIDKRCFTMGLFAGKSSGIDFGYRWSDKHVCIGYDVINKGIVGRFNLDLK